MLALTSSSEDEEKTLAWVKKREVGYAWAWDEDASLMGFFGVRGIPHAVLVDPRGEILWRGHPAQLSEELLERAVEGALGTPLWELPKVREPLAEGRYAAALAAAEGMESEAGEAIVSLLRRRIESKMQRIAEAREAGDFLTAQELAEETAQELAGLPEAVKAAEIVAALQEDEEAQRIIGGQIKLRAVFERLREVETRNEAEGILEELRALADAYPDTIVARRAGRTVSALEERLKS